MSLDDKKDPKKILGFEDSLNSELKTDYKGALYNSVNPGQNEKEKQENNFNKTESDIELNKITYKIKLILVGDSYVGKTSIINRYCENKFEEKRIIATISVAFKRRCWHSRPGVPHRRYQSGWPATRGCRHPAAGRPGPPRGRRRR